MPESSEKNAFITLAMELGVLKFGEFTLKSGRVSPYFFNAGLFNTGGAVAALGRHYARRLVDSGIGFDMLFGPAYKGIPLATVTAAALFDAHGRDVPFAYNRKEAKTHGEGGTTVGAPLEGRVLIVDDVITAGTAIRESFDIISAAGALPAGVLIALDRQERGQTELSAVQEVARDFAIPVIAIIGLDDLIGFLEARDEATLTRVEDYRKRYGIRHNVDFVTKNNSETGDTSL